MSDRGRVEEHRGRSRLLLGAAVLVAVSLGLIAWNRAAASPRLCSSCHAMGNATLSAARSVHADVPCLACHTRPGLLGSLRYVPTLARETLATVTGWRTAHGVLRARPCSACHDDLASSPGTAVAHEDRDRDCAACHGEVAHPQAPLVARAAPQPSGTPHPEGFAQTHGEQAVASPASCTSCHGSTFCESCHLDSSYPHPERWIRTHGAAQQREGAESCALCHPSTFCAGCHGTEIPHRSDWLAQHWRALQDAPVTPCLVCHPRTDCTTCHSLHDVHPEQSVYTGGTT